MAPGIALEALGETNTPLRVLDPMTGSGTVLAVARARGHRAFGVDLDPLAVVLARVWTRTIDAQQIRDRATAVLSQARRLFASLPTSKAYPNGSDEETRAFIRYWFDDYARRQLAALAQAIGGVHDSGTREVLWCGFSRLIITKQAGASLAMDLSHSRPHKTFTRAPLKPFAHFLTAVERVVSNCPHAAAGEAVGPVAVVKTGDARKLNIAAESIDLVLTSPPYLNAIDYMRCSKFSLVWMGYNVSALREIRSESVGTEASSKHAVDEPWVQSLIKSLSLKPALSARDHALLSTYAWDMNRALSEVSRVLCPQGRAVYVVGESTSRGTFIRNSAIITGVAERQGLKLMSRHWRGLPENRRYLPPPGKGKALLDGRVRREVIVEFRKAG
jgi:SAM-dependent methyltransferase